MNTQISHKDIIDSKFLFWGSHDLKTILTEEEQEKLCDIEIYDWLSGLYWGEGIAMNYALKMSETRPDKEKWLEVYRDEHRHQTILSNWFVERGLTPLPKNKLITFAFNLVETINSEMSEEKLTKTIYATQVFFEELFHALLKVRLKYIKDRSLKAIFYQIFQDESEHLGKARSEIMELNGEPKKLYETLEKQKNKLFPLDIAKSYLSEEQISQVKKVQESIVLKTLENARSNEHLFKPVQILYSFQKVPGYNCYACSPKRHDGLHLEPNYNKELEQVEDYYIFPKRCEGFNGVVHGGFTAMILDEIMGYASILDKQLLPLTQSMDITYKRPILVGQTYHISAKVQEIAGQMVLCKGTIKDMNGITCAQSEGKMYVPTRTQAPKLLGKLAHNEFVNSMFLEKVE